MLNETWAKSYKPQMKHQSNEWRHYGSPRKSESSSEPQQCESYGDSRVRLWWCYPNAYRSPTADRQCAVLLFQPSYIRTKTRYIEQLKDIIADYLASNPARRKRRLLDVGEDILKFLFGTLTQSDTQKYTEHIQELENEQQSFLRISREQMIILNQLILRSISLCKR